MNYEVEFIKDIPCIYLIICLLYSVFRLIIRKTEAYRM